MSNNKKGAKELFEEVIDQRLCTYCGACAGGCPYLVSYEGRIVVLDKCTISEGKCYEYCPRTPTDINAISYQTFGEAYKDDELGAIREVMIARSADDHIRKRAQYGGTVTTLMSLALEEGFIDCGILAKMSDDKIPGSYLARSKEEILQCAGTSYVAYPLLEALNHIPEESTEKLGIVGTPCQVLSLSKMKQDPPQNRVNIGNIKLLIGLFCTWALSFHEFHQFLRENLDLPKVIKFDIPPPPASQFDVYSESGKTSLPLDEIRRYIMPSCSYCLDMTAEFADISVGSAEGIEGWNTVIIRTKAGEDLMRLAKAKGALKTEILPDENLAHLKEAALNKKKAALKNLVERTGNRNDFLYIYGLSEGITDKFLENK